MKDTCSELLIVIISIRMKHSTYFQKKDININSSIYRIITIITIITVLNLIACFYNLVGNFGRG